MRWDSGAWFVGGAILQIDLGIEFLFFGEITSKSILYGGLLIFLGGFYVAYRERLNK